MSTRNRKYDSGAEKRKKKQRLETAIQSQKGALERFIVRETAHANVIEADTPAAQVLQGDNTLEFDIEAPAAEIPEGGHDDGTANGGDDGDQDHDNGTANGGDDGDQDHDNGTANGGDDGNISNHINNSFQPDIFDPRTWNALDSKMIYILLQKGPKRDLSIKYGPRDRFGRRFSASSYNRILPNRETCDREWLVYSKDLDKVFCFCCKLIKKGLVRGQLANEGFND